MSSTYARRPILQPIQATSSSTPSSAKGKHSGFKTFMSANQILHSVRKRNNQLPPINRQKIISYQEAVAQDGPTKVEKFDPHRKFKKVANLVMSSVLMDHAAKNEWIRQEHGGIKMWVNQKTGEVSTAINPNRRFKPKPESEWECNNALPTSFKPRRSFHIRQSIGASEIYDGKEVEELFGLLDKDHRFL